MIGTAGRASTSTSREGTHASVAGTRDQVTLGDLEGGEGRRLGLVRGLTSAPETGTALLGTAAHTILPAAPAASSAVLPRMNPPLVAVCMKVVTWRE